PSVLKSFIVIIGKMIIVVRIYKEIIISCKYKRGTYMKLGKLCIMWVFDHEHFFVVIVQISSLFITQVRICISVTNNLARFLYPYGAVVRCNDNTYIALGEPL